MTRPSNKFKEAASKPSPVYLVGVRVAKSNVGKKDRMKEAIDKVFARINKLIEADDRKGEVKITNRIDMAAMICVQCDADFAKKIEQLPGVSSVRKSNTTPVPKPIITRPRLPKPNR